MYLAKADKYSVYFMVQFVQLKKINWEKIIDISCKTQHIFAVCSNGRVFAVGKNFTRELVPGEKAKRIDKFEVLLLHMLEILIHFSKQKTDKAQKNTANFCLTHLEKNVYYSVETLISKSASFCIASNHSLVFFIGENLPSKYENHREYLLCF